MNDQNGKEKDEFKRVLELSEFDLDYSDLNNHLKDLSRLAARVAGTEISLVNLIDTYTQWSVSKFGFDVDSMPREDSVCQYTILEDDFLEIKNLREDDRVKEKSYVSGEPHLKYYFGIPLKTDEGNNIGALCVVDREEKELTPEKIELLKIIADEIVTRLQTTKRLSELEEKLEEMSETHRKVSHDIRGPISGIIGLSQLIKEQGSDKSIDLDSIMELMDLIHKGGQSVLELADEILGANDKQQIHNEPGRNEFNLITFKEKLIQLYTPQAKSKEVDLTVDYDQENNGIPFSKNKLLQITGNLISNAIKFTPEGGRVDVKMALDQLENSNRLSIEVSDTGIGIDEDQIKLIKSGESESTDGTGGERGYGFGLSLVKHLVDNLGGTMDIDSQIGKGTTFRIELPRES